MIYYHSASHQKHSLDTRKKDHQKIERNNIGGKTSKLRER